jgi:16S rRNA (cytidine1402-2'-O)-methyltransferase
MERLLTESHPGTLYVVASAIGNPQDLSPRALETLRTADLVLAEDTRSARKLLDGHGIDRRTQSCFDANEPARAAQAATLLRSGASIALLSEAGTPTVSDPGYRVVRAAIAAGARVVPVPGPSAVLAALVGSGLPTDRFFFVGFPPRKTGARQALLAQLRSLPATLVFFESPHRVASTLADLSAVLGKDRPACLARELTKTHEEFVRGTLAELADRYASERPLGEVTLVVGGASEQEQAKATGTATRIYARARGRSLGRACRRAMPPTPWPAKPAAHGARPTGWCWICAPGSTGRSSGCA